jgi:hypothetical protein
MMQVAMVRRAVGMMFLVALFAACTTSAGRSVAGDHPTLPPSSSPSATQNVSQSTPPLTVVTGKVLQDTRFGYPQPNERGPMPNETVLAKDRSGLVVARTRTDQHGMFRLKLPVGSYTLTLRVTCNRLHKPQPKATVSVTHASIHGAPIRMTCYQFQGI